MSTIAIVGAGPGMGLAIARTFGLRGFDVALVARDRAKLDRLVDELDRSLISAAAFPADVLDHDALTTALEDAASRFGTIKVLEFSPVGTPADTRMTFPTAMAPADVQSQIELQLYGAIAATKAVLPAMRAAGTGTLLYTTGAGSLDPVPVVGNVNAAAAALRNWVLGLHRELAEANTGVQAAHVAIDVSLGAAAVPGFPTAEPSEVAPVYWDLHHSKRDQAETVFSR